MFRNINKRSAVLLAAAVVVTGCAGNSSDKGNDGANKETPVLPEPVTGTSWTARTIFDQSADSAESTLNITEDDTSNGSTGCNNFTGPVDIKGTDMSFGLLATTRKMCEPTIAGQERAFLEALGVTQKWTRLGDTLKLMDENNAVVMELGLNDK